jgi:hypothetical protein
MSLRNSCGLVPRRARDPDRPGDRYGPRAKSTRAASTSAEWGVSKPHASLDPIRNAERHANQP